MDLVLSHSFIHSFVKYLLYATHRDNGKCQPDLGDLPALPSTSSVAVSRVLKLA